MNKQKKFLCICCDFKGGAFMTALHELGHQVFLVTSEKNRNETWPHDHITEIFYMPGEDGRTWNLEDLILGTAHLFKNNFIDKIIALDDYDVWKAATLREEFRSPGMGQTTSRHFYDKLAMRMIAKDNQLPNPAFSHLFHDDEIHEFLDKTAGPWVVKPRSDAGSLGIRKLASQVEFWDWNETHHERRHAHLIEEFKPGAVYHVDSLFQDYNSIFTRSSQYLQTPFEVAHGGGIFRSQTLEVDEADSQTLQILNDRVIKAFGLKFGASHSEYIKDEAGNFNFLETSARVGGAHLADMVEAASGINLWSEWAKIESALLLEESYQVPVAEQNNAGIIATLSKYQYPDYSQFDDDSIWWKMNKEYHIGFIFKDPAKSKITSLLDTYAVRLRDDFHATVPLKE